MPRGFARVSVQRPDGTESYTYDNLNRITGVTYTDGTVQSYTYDAVGNRLTKVENSTQTTYAYDANDRLTSAGSTTYGYDANGNQTGAGGNTYTWDDENRLSGASNSSGSVSYTYRGDGLRASKTVGGVTTSYIWDLNAANPVILQDGTYSYVYGYQLISQTDNSGNQTYFLGDDLGSTKVLTDASGNVTAQAFYDVFGNVRSHSGTGTSEYLFAGQEYDSTLGYLYLRARYYDPTTGRFISKDPLVNGASGNQGYNRYAYVANDPTNAVDPSGHEPDCGVLGNTNLDQTPCSSGFLGAGGGGGPEGGAPTETNTADSAATCSLATAEPGNAPSTAFGRSIQSLREFLASGKGPWRWASAHGEPPTSLSYTEKGANLSMEEVFENVDTGERIVRHTVWKGQDLLHEALRLIAKFGL